MADMSRVTFKSSDNDLFQVDEAVAYEILKNIFEDIGTDDAISLPIISSEILAKVTEYCKYHVLAQKTSEEKPAVPKDEVKKSDKKWDAEFVKVDLAMLIGLLQAAHYLNIKNLLDLTQQTLVDKIKRMSPEVVLSNFSSGIISTSRMTILLKKGRRSGGSQSRKNLLDLTCQTVADIINGKSPEDIRKTFDINNDFTLELEEGLKREDKWCFEK